MVQSIRRNVTWTAVLIAGLVAGTVFLIVNVVLTPIYLDIDAPLVLTYFASVLLGGHILDDTTSANMAVGIVVHYGLSLGFALVISIVIHRWGLWVGVIGGAVLGACLYAINVYTLTYYFEWFFAIHSNVLLLSHILFGAVVGGIYEMFDHYDLPLWEEGAHGRA